MRVISVLQMQHTTLEEWRLLPPPGKNIGQVGSAMSHLWDWTLGYRTIHLPTGQEPSQGTQ